MTDNFFINQSFVSFLFMRYLCYITFKIFIYSLLSFSSALFCLRFTLLLAWTCNLCPNLIFYSHFGFIFHPFGTSIWCKRGSPFLFPFRYIPLCGHFRENRNSMFVVSYVLLCLIVPDIFFSK